MSSEIATALERRARDKSGFIHKDGVWVTGHANQGSISVRYYPSSQRLAWFDENGPITKRLALKLLDEQSFAREMAATKPKWSGL